MPRANRYFIPGYIWHITHRCHKQKYLLKFSQDKKRYLYWLWQAKKRYSLKVLNYVITSNHIHLLLLEHEKDPAIPRSMQLVAGRTAQEYNKRKRYKGSFWEDRYHATAIESGQHLVQCMIYIDLNMVRAGVVSHPSHWIFSGYYDCYSPRKRYLIIDYELLCKNLYIKSLEDLKKMRTEWIQKALVETERLERQSKWSESVAVGSDAFLQQLKKNLGYRGRGCKIKNNGDELTLSENWDAYLPNLAPKMSNKKGKEL